MKAYNMEIPIISFWEFLTFYFHINQYTTKTGASYKSIKYCFSNLVFALGVMSTKLY